MRNYGGIFGGGNMIKVNLIAVGKVKEKYFAEGIAEYSKRLSAFCDFNIIEVGEENFIKFEPSLIETIKEKEGKKIKEKLKGYVIAFCLEGKKLSSEDFAEKIKDFIDKGIGEISFVIGGSYGLSDEIKNLADYKLSFSDMTFPHTLFRLISCEQIYRAFSIIKGNSYHK